MSSRGFLVLVLLVTCSVAEQATEFAEASDGGTASLPCSLAPTQIPDKIANILWYRGAEESPFYKYDAKNVHPQHWAEPALQNRYFLRVLDDQRAILSISPAKHSDENVFHCRVDFQQSPTKITHVNLTVIVPPTSVQVSDSAGLIKNGITSSYAEGASITLTCTATAGRPLARVSWWRDGELIVDETQYFPERAKSQSVLKIDKLTRSHLLAVYSCEVNNSKLQRPLVVRVAIDMYLRPLEVTLLGNNPEFSAGKKYNVTCRSKGSRPPAIITWWKDGILLEGGIVTVSSDGNTTTSVLSFNPSAADHGLVLACKASNQRIPLSERQQTWMLKVLYPPKVALSLGHRLDGNDIKEGADVYFECHLIANPWVRHVWWLRNSERLHSNASAGIIVSNQTLVLQGVSRASSGKYSCEATNKEGTSSSPPFHLRVKYEPVCKDGIVRKVVGAAKDEPVQVECKLDAEPPATQFRWSFNSTPGISREMTEHIVEEEDISVLTYIPHSASDYGTLQCWGTNEIGVQRVACTYHVVPAGRPDPPQGCSMINITHHSVTVTCKKGFDGGLKQKFVLMLYAGDLAVANISALATPEFYIPNLEPAQEYYASIYSFNSKGSSKYPNSLQIRTLPAPGLKELRRSTEPSESPTKAISGPWLYIMLAAGSTLIVAAAVGLIIFAIRRFRVESPTRNPQIRSPKQEETPSNSIVQPIMTDSLNEDDNNPDLIPPTYESLLDSSTLPPYTITARPQSKRNCATQMPVKPYHVTWAPILQSRNCSTQTPPPHKESSV
ncbi:nephrin-like [Cylas formicarius]|uniref:nephrin-like n=1 Tax=Cylas formicarius TaxID=197179 RepID=UPI0029588534|nr:nephrin-like [Cylas formicarius]XP_060522803.1 nephrin-like [Cylas formicarius]